VFFYKLLVSLVRDTLKRTHFKPEFLFALNNLKSILHGSSNDSHISGPIEWMTINPGTQAIGSFNPVDKNFYEDAYRLTDEQREKLKNRLRTERDEKKKAKPVLTKYVWR
jgi:hypothetical protein